MIYNSKNSTHFLNLKSYFALLQIPNKNMLHLLFLMKQTLGHMQGNPQFHAYFIQVNKIQPKQLAAVSSNIALLFIRLLTRHFNIYQHVNKTNQMNHKRSVVHLRSGTNRSINRPRLIWATSSTISRPSNMGFPGTFRVFDECFDICVFHHLGCYLP